MPVRHVQLTKRTKPSYEIKMMFDTGAATHVCPWWFGEQITTYKYKGPELNLYSATGASIPVYVIRTTCFQLQKNEPWIIGSTFIV